jgi:hypothetical protein
VKAKPAVFQKELHYTSKTLVLILWQFKWIYESKSLEKNDEVRIRI